MIILTLSKITNSLLFHQIFYEQKILITYRYPIANHIVGDDEHAKPQSKENGQPIFLRLGI